MAEDRYNMRNPAVKRILQEVKELQNNPSDDYASLPLEDNIFEWHFAIRGPQESEFEGGIYHGRIQLPPEYPFKPPAFMLLTPNGRFETQTKICLSISQHHPEHWQPSWSVRTALVALIAFMPTKPDGALGSLDYTKEERRALALKSRAAAPKFGNADRQRLIDEIHDQLLKNSPPVPDLPEATPLTPAADDEAEPVDDDSGSEGDSDPEMLHNVHELHVNANAGPIAVSFSAGIRVATRAPATLAGPNAELQDRAAPALEARASAPRAAAPRRRTSEDFGLTVLAIALTIAIIAVFINKMLSRSAGSLAQAPVDS